MEFPLSKEHHKNVVVFQDLFTRWIELRPLRSADGKGIANVYEELILFGWEAPDYLLTDNGKEFDNKTLNRLFKEYGVIRVTTPPYHPQVNPVERSNRTLKTMISTFVKSNHRNWDQHLHELRHAIDVSFQIGDRVMRRVHVPSSGVQGFSAKLATKYEGSYDILVRKSPTVYVLGMKDGRKEPKGAY